MSLTVSTRSCFTNVMPMLKKEAMGDPRQDEHQGAQHCRLTASIATTL
jgi:hypothetical protein